MSPDAKNPEIGSKEKSSNRFGADLSQIAAGTLVSQIILVVLTPIITRIYNPTIYGIASTFIAITNILLVICCLRYEQAIMIPQDNKDAGALLTGSILILSIFSILLIPVIVLFGETITCILNIGDINPYLYLLPLVIITGGIFLALKFWNLRKKRFGTQAVTQITQYVIYPGSQIGLGISGFATVGSLVISDVFAKISCICVYGLQLFKDDLGMLKASVSFTSIKTQLKKYKKFPLLNTWSELLSCLSWQLPVLLLSAFFSSEIAGQYSLAYRTLLLPLSLIGGSVGQVLFQRASVAIYDNALPSLVEDVVSLIIIISLLPLLFIGILGADVFSIIFSSQWELSGTFVQILCVWMVVWFIASPLMNLINVLGIQGFGLKYNLMSVVVRCLALVLGGLSGSVYLALILFAAVSFFLDTYVGCMILSKCKCSLRHVFQKIGKPCFVTLVVAGFVLIVHFVLDAAIDGFVAPIFSMGIAAACEGLYVVYLFRKNEIVKEYLRLWG